jgi:hypothetical protein
MNLEEHDSLSGHGVYKESELSKYREIINSQCGEEGIIDEIFKRIKSDNKQCVEFGAHNGVFLSNTKHLIDNGWMGVMIEGDKVLFQQLKKNMGNDAICIHKMVKNVDEVLEKTPLESDFDLISIDIDNGMDGYLWGNMVNYKPKVVLIEFGVHDNSLKILKSLAEEMGYSLVATTCWNAFFIRKDYMEHFKRI